MLRRLARVLPALTSLTLLVACGGQSVASAAAPDGGTTTEDSSVGGPAAGGPSDAGASAADSGTGDAEGGVSGDFASRVDQIVSAAQQNGNTNCATALPNVAVADAAEMKLAVQRFVAGVVGPVDEVSYDAVACGGAGHADCATQFQHMMFKADGELGTALLPLAREVALATNVEDASQTTITGGLSKFASVSIAGIDGGHLVGIVWFEGRQRCK